MPIKPAPSVLRAMLVLEFLASRRGSFPTMSEISRQTGLSKATCHSVLLALAEGEYVRREPQSLTYSLGPALIPLGAAASSGLRLPDISRPELEELSEALGVMTVGAIRVGAQMLVISTIGPTQPFHGSLPVGDTVPFAPPLGAAFIAWSSPPEIEDWLDSSPRPLTEPERGYFRRALATVRSQGYSVTLSIPPSRQLAGTVGRDPGASGAEATRIRRDALIGELGTPYLPERLEAGRSYSLTQVSAPVFDHTGSVAMVILGIAVGRELTSDQVAAYGQRLRQSAQRLTRSIGGSDAPFRAPEGEPAVADRGG